MNNKSVIAVATGLMAVAACSQSTVDLDAERAALKAAADAYHAAGAAADADAVAALYTSDAAILPPNEATVRGADGMLEYARGFTAMPNFSMAVSDMTLDVGAGGDMAYTLANATVGFDGPDGSRVTEDLRDFHVWRKVDGAWKVAVDVWNSPDPASAAASNPLEGAWIVTSWTDAEGNVNDEPLPALYVFTPTHYSVMIGNGDAPRANYEGDSMTDAAKIAAYDTIIANSGRYEIDGNLLKTRAYVAKDPNYMGGWPENEVNYEFSVDGDMLTIRNLVFTPGVTGTFRQVEGTPNPW